jgi:hypothetical protein
MESQEETGFVDSLSYLQCKARREVRVEHGTVTHRAAPGSALSEFGIVSSKDSDTRRLGELPSTSCPRGVVLRRPPRFGALQMAALLQMPRMRGNGHKGHAEETPGNDFSNLKTVEVLLLYFR